MVHGGALAGRAVLPALRLSEYPVRHQASDQPGKAEMEEDIGIDTTPENLLRAVAREVRIEYDENA